MEPKKDERLTFLSLEDVCRYLKSYCIEGKDLKEEDLVEVNSNVPFTASEFWGREKQSSWLKKKEEWKVGSDVPLSVVVASACFSCNFVLREYQKIADYVTSLIGYHLLHDEVDSNSSLSIVDESRGEQYLRRLFLVMKEQGMLNGCEISSFIGSRQQCSYGCLCIVLLFCLPHTKVIVQIYQMSIGFIRL